MRTYKAKNGKEFRLAGLELTDRGDILTIFWIATGKYEEKFFGEVEPYLLVGEFAPIVPEVVEPIVVVEVVKKATVKRKPKETGPDLFAI